VVTLPAAVRLLPTAWWFPDMPGLRSTDSGTYVRHDFDDLPPLAPEPGLAWLAGKGDAETSIADGWAERAFTRAGVEAVSHGLTLPPSFVQLSEVALQRKIESVTSCYLDLGNRPFETESGGFLVHFLSDQQWCMHWSLYVDASGGECVVASGAPIGFDVDMDDDERIPEPVPLDGSVDMYVCAHSFDEFIYRFSIENELWLALHGKSEWTPLLRTYAASLPSIS
jgi:hypothetical protein